MLSLSLNPIGSVWESSGRFIIAVLRVEPRSGWYEDDHITALVLCTDAWPEKVGSLYHLVSEGLQRNYVRIA